MESKIRLLTADEIESVTGGLLDTNIALALGIQTQVGNNLAIGGGFATQALTGAQAAIATLLPH